jgi:hypothetical protein
MSAADQAREVPWKPKHNPWAIAVVAFAAFMEILDTTVVNVALPHIAGSLSVSNDDATWALTSYLVANGSCRQRYRADDFGLAERGDRAQALFSDLPTIVHCLFSPLRYRNDLNRDVTA